jgi:hypothetical protein
MRNIMDMTIDVEPRRYGEIELRIIETNEWYDCEVWISKGKVECNISDFYTGNESEYEMMQQRVIAATLETCARHIEGFEDFMVDECDGDIDYAIELLLKRNGNVESGSYSNYNRRIQRNIEASSKDMFVHESLKRKHTKKLNEKTDWDAWEEEWNRREKTEFGKTLIKLDKEMFNMFGEYDEYGMPESPLSYIKMDYFDGDNDLLRIAKRVEYKLENYDMLQEPHIKRLLNKLYRLANNPTATNESISYMRKRRLLY